MTSAQGRGFDSHRGHLVDTPFGKFGSIRESGTLFEILDTHSE